MKLFLGLISLAASSVLYSADVVDVEASLPKLGSESYKERQTAQTAILSSLLKYKDSTKLEQEMRKIFKLQIRQQDPELRHRLYQTLAKTAPRLHHILGRPFIGISMNDSRISINNRNISCIRVSSIVSGSPAAAAGLKLNDQIVSIGDTDLSNKYSRAVTALKQELLGYAAGETVEIRLYRNREHKIIHLKLGVMPNKIKKQIEADDKMRVQQLKQFNMQGGQPFQFNLQAQQGQPLRLQVGPNGIQQLVVPQKKATKAAPFGNAFFKRWYTRQLKANQSN